MKGNIEHLNHEKIHLAQQLECILIGFYLIYLFNYLYNRFIKKQTHMKAYGELAFELEAYANDNNIEYLKSRPRYSWIKYFK